MGLVSGGCSYAQKAEEVQQQAGRASKEIRETLGVEPAISLKIQFQDDMQVVQANVRMATVPQGMDAEQVRKQVNIIVRKHVKGVTDVSLTF
jgi:hypothetical protein